MTNRTRSHELDSLGKIETEIAFMRKGWTVEHFRHDYGEDLFVRIFRQGKASRYSFFVQVKGTDSPSRLLSKSRDGYFCRVKSSHIHHWLSFVEPVFLVLYDAITSDLYWTSIHEPEFQSCEGIEIAPTANTMSVFVPKDNLLDAAGVDRLYAKAKRHIDRLRSEQEGVATLIKLLKSEYGLTIIYDSAAGVINFPTGTFLLTKDSQDLNHVLFGELARLFQSSNYEPIELMKKGYLYERELIQHTIDAKAPTLLKRIRREAERLVDLELARLPDDGL